MKKATVIYHSADFDGIFCREIARKFLGEKDVEFIGWDYGNPKPKFPEEGRVYVLDLAPECFEEATINAFSRLIWIDHHATAIKRWDSDTSVSDFGTPPQPINGYRIDGVAACRLAWQWFTAVKNDMEDAHFLGLPKKQDFIDRKVSEPYAVQLAGEFDIWDKRNPAVDVFQLGLRSQELSAQNWKWLLTVRDPLTQSKHALALTIVEVDVLLETGRVIQVYQERMDAETVKRLARVVIFEGLKFLALNTAQKGSMQFAALDVPETGHDALMAYVWDGGQWAVSLYHAKHRTDLDLSAIAVRHCGGGHKGACGFRINYTGWMMMVTNQS